jgi:5'-nucleotidase
VLKAGDITWETMDRLADDGRIAETTLTGQEIKKLLNAQFSQTNQNRFLAISGFTYTWGGSPGSVVDVFDAQGVPLLPNQSYAIAIPYFWRNTALNLLTPMPANLTLGPVLADAFATCLKAMPTVTATVDGRSRRIIP